MTIGEKQRIAVVGSGISGLTVAHLLSSRHEVTVFEANDYIGGHTHTVPVDMAGRRYAVDTGFIVCNDWNYPSFFRLMARLSVDMQPTQMSFSVRNDVMDLEYNGHNLNTLFAQRSNLARPGFYRFITDILTFNKAAKNALDESPQSAVTLDEFVSRLRLGDMFRNNYLLPMVAAIWSCSVRQAGDFPLAFFLRFFHNHGLLNIRDRPQWHVLKGGSHSYIEPLIAPFKERLYLQSPVVSIANKSGSVEVVTSHGSQVYDQVVVACHSDQALQLLAQPTELERRILGAMAYQDNQVVLHSDPAVMPKRKTAWASWNFMAGAVEGNRLPQVSYYMNTLQRLDCDEPLLVTLNADHKIRPDKVIQKFNYAHPVYSEQAVTAQKRREAICGVNRIHYCGAYWYNGFHEDGVRSALDVCRRFGVGL